MVSTTMKIVLIILMILVEGLMALPPMPRGKNWRKPRIYSKNSLRTVAILRRYFNLSKQVPIKDVLRHYGKYATKGMIHKAVPPQPIPYWKRSTSNLLKYVIKRLKHV